MKVKGNLQLIRKAEARKIGPPCKCQKKCFDILGNDAVNNIFKDYWALADYNLQTMDLQKKITKQDIKRKRTKNEECVKSGTYNYFVYYNDKKYQVCKVAFLSIHGIGRKRANIAYNKKTETGTTIKDQRGTNPNLKKISGPKLECVHKHIQSLPVRSSHYTRYKNPHRQYLDCKKHVSINEMYNW